MTTVSAVSTVSDAKTRNRYVRRAAAFAGLGGLLFGYDTGVIGGALPLISDDFNWNSPFLRGVITSSLLLGAALGALVAGRLSDSLGRRRLILITAVIFIVGIVGCTFAPDAPVLVAFRVIIGLGVGSASVVVPLYIGEIVPPDVRGRLVSLNQLAITLGILISELIAYFLTASGQWRTMILLAAIPSAILLVGMLFQPESPAWLVERGRENDARAIMRKTHGPKDDVDGEIREIKTVAEKREGAGALLDTAVRPALIVGITLAVIQQVTGINTVIYYAPTLLESAGLGSHAAIGATVIVGLINVLLTIVALRLLDRVGRRPLLLGGTLGMIVGLIVLGAAFVGQGDHVATGHAVVAIAALCVFVGSFAIGLGPVFWLLIAEIYPLRVRGSAMSCAGVANWLANFVVAIGYLSILAAIGKTATFWGLAGVTVISYAFMRMRVPETKGRPLTEIEADLRGLSDYAPSDRRQSMQQQAAL
jgi:sugar porter (SP) family MFS transporter